MTRSLWWRWYVGILAVLALACIPHLRHGPPLGSDDHGQYLLHARALANGTPYTDIGFIHTPYTTMVAPIAEPPGVPLLVAGVFRAVGEGRGAERVILWAALALWTLLVFRYVARIASPTTAAIVALLSAIPLARQHALDNVLADLPFLAAMWGVFLVADGGSWREWPRVLLLAAFGAMAFSFRMAALPLLPAAATMLLLRTPQERVGVVATGAAWTGAAALVMFGLPSASVLAGETVRATAQLVQDARWNVIEIVQGLRAWMPQIDSPRLLRIGLHAGLFGLAAVGMATNLRQRARSFAWIAAAWYVIMLVALPTRAERYIWPLLPFVALAVLDGVARVASWFRLRAPIATAFGAALVLFSVFNSVSTRAPDTWKESPDVVSLAKALRAEAAATAKPMAVVSFSPRVMTWEEGYRSMPHFSAPEPRMLQLMDSTGITHVVTGDRGTDSDWAFALDSLIVHRPDRFHEVFTNPSFRVLRLVPPTR